ncbi:rootletin-like [Petromyzon marinus]|uniref:rootletin-like n=1 Tax=Petromyzon marinus TaxID=7757 RepID=UPI003F6FCB1E
MNTQHQTDEKAPQPPLASSSSSTSSSNLRLETVIQRLEDTVLNPDLDEAGKSLRIRSAEGTTTTITGITGGTTGITGAGNTGGTSLIPARIREIVTRHLQQDVPDAPSTMASLLSVQEENRLLQKELSRMEDQLSQCHADRDTLAIKYNALSERVSTLLLHHYYY